MENNIINKSINLTMQVSQEENNLLERYRNLEDREKKLVQLMIDYYTADKNFRG